MVRKQIPESLKLQLLAAGLQGVKVVTAALQITVVVSHAVCKRLGLAIARLLWLLGQLFSCLLCLSWLRVTAA
jgi:hypothetical protein